MKKLSVIRLARYRSEADWRQKGLLPSELEILLTPREPGEKPAREGGQGKRKTSAKSARRS